MNTNFCIGCGAPLEINQNFTEKKCSYCGLDNSYVTPRRENKTFFQRFFAFKRTILPKRNNKYVETEEKYRKRTKTIVDNQISQIQKREIIKNNNLLRKNKPNLGLKLNFNSIKWKVRRKFVLLLFMLLVGAGILNYFIVRYRNPELKISFSSLPIEEQVRIKIDNAEYLEALKLMRKYRREPFLFKYPREKRLLRGIAEWKLNGSSFAEEDIDAGIRWCDSWNDLSFYYCRWARGIKGRMREDIHSDLNGALFWARLNKKKYPNHVWASAELSRILFKQNKYDEFIKESKYSVSLLKKDLTPPIKKFIREEIEETLKEIYFFQAQYYFKKGRKAYKKAYFAIDNAIKLDPNYQDAVNFRKKIYCAEMRPELDKKYRQITGC